jgi:cytochrome c-type biogenesis protein CcmH/NrfG
MLVAGAVVVAALLAAWSQWQPQRSEEARQEAEARLETHDRTAAIAAADSAVSRDPLSVEALFTLASVQQVSGRPGLARATLERAVRLQPSNPQTWLVLGRYDLTNNNPQAAVTDLQAAIYLNPESISAEAVANGQREAIEVHNDYIQALLASAAKRESAARAASAASSVQHRAALRSAYGSHARAAAGGLPGGHRSSAPESRQSRTP